MKYLKRFLLIVCPFVLLTSSSYAATTIINAFNAGELSPLLYGRTDVSKYYSGCQTLENFIPLPYGGITRRPGTKYIASAKSASGNVRLIPFEYSTTQAYILEFGDEYMRVYMDGGQVQSGGSAYEITMPYDETDLFELQYIQSADTMYIVHPEYAPRTLTRTGHTSWTISQITFERGPFLDENTTTTTITPSATSGTITLTASTSTFNANHVGALWQVTHTVAGVNEDSSFSNNVAAQNTSSVTVQKGRTFDFSTHGTWTGDIVLQRSYDSGSTWKDIRPVHYEDDGNIQYSDEEIIDDAIYRVHVAAGSDGIDSGTCNVNLTARSYDVDGVVTISGYTSGTVVTGTVTETLGGTSAVTTWSEGAWSPDEGYPSVVAFYEERVAYAATTNRPQTIWMSQTNDWNNFLAGTDDSDALNYTIASDQVNAIRWLASQTSLLIGTTGGEWKMSANTTGEPLTPTNVNIRKQSSYGSENMQPAIVNNVVLFVQRQGKKLRELVYNFENDVYVAPDMTVLSEHITGDGIAQMAFQKTPDPILWCVTDDGDLVSMTYNREQDVIAWAKHIVTVSDREDAYLPTDYPVLFPADDTTIPDLAHEIPISSLSDLWEKMFPAPYNIISFSDAGGGKVQVTLKENHHWEAGDYLSLSDPPSNNYAGNIYISEVIDSKNFTIVDTWAGTATGTVYQRDFVTGHFYLTNDIDASITSDAGYVNSYGTVDGAGWVPLGVIAEISGIRGFAGTLDGCGYTISNLYQDRTSAALYKWGGLFKNVESGAIIANLTIENAEINCPKGGILAYGSALSDQPFSVYNCHTSGIIKGTGSDVGTIGGMVGYIEGLDLNNTTKFYDCTSSATVDVKNYHTDTSSVINIGGFVGWSSDNAEYFNCHATGNVLQGPSTTGGNVGGFAGFGNSQPNDYYDCSASGNVEGTDNVGGFFGDGSLDAYRCSATGDVTVTGANAEGGGFAGDPMAGIVDCYSWGNVTASNPSSATVGGFISDATGMKVTLGRAYSIGTVTAATAGGFAGTGAPSLEGTNLVLSNYWDINTSGISYSSGDFADGYTTTQMKTRSNYANSWDFVNVWDMEEDKRSNDAVGSVAIISGDGEDEIWLAITRIIDGSLVRYIEQFQPRDWGDEQRDAFFVDSGLTYDGGPTVNITDIKQQTPISVTVDSLSGLAEGDQVRITGVVGMTELNDNVYTISTISDNIYINGSFYLKDSTNTVDIDSSGFTAYISGGTIEKVENTFTTLSHLEGETLDIQADGGYYGQETVSGGTITLDDYYNTVHAGLPYTSKVLPMMLAAPSTNIQGKVKRITANTIRLNDTLGLKVGDSWDSYDPLVFRDQGDPLEAPPPLYTGIKKLSFTGGYEEEGNIYIQQDEPLPCTVVSIVPEFEVYR